MELPIFPLNGAVLFPGTNLPLNIFENRYIDMVDYALARNREIGMIQSDDNNDLYKVGCVGKINSFNETNDGRYLISLQGTNCFKIIKEIKVDYSFRLVDTELIKKIEENKSVLKDENRKKILQKYKQYIEQKKINLDLIELDGIDTFQLMKFISMISPFKHVEKQALLESKTMLDFYEKLLSVIELEIADEYQNKTIN